jgi:hypothetical protein
MRVSDVTLGQIIKKQFGEENGAEMLRELQAAVDKKLPADQLRAEATALAKKHLPATASSDTDVVSGVSRMLLVAA